MRDLEKIKLDYYDMFNMNYAEGIARVKLAEQIEKIQSEFPDAYNVSQAPVVALIFRSLAEENLMHMRALLNVAKEYTTIDKVNRMTKH